MPAIAYLEIVYTTHITVYKCIYMRVQQGILCNSTLWLRVIAARTIDSPHMRLILSLNHV